ncbi:MAG: amidohydrolase family protein [Thermodesulfobacteriota bacterium]
MNIIDVWMQHPTGNFLQQPMFDSLRRWSGENFIPDIPLAATIGAMDQAGVRIGLVAAWWGPQGALIHNDEVASFVREYPQRLCGVASVNLARPMEAVRELRRCVKQLGFRGLRIVPWLWGLPPDDRRYYPLYAECIELDIPFCLQVGHTGPLMTSEPGRPIPYLEHVALEFPELRVVAGHIGAPWIQEMILLARKFPNVYIDTSAYKATRFPPDFVEFMRGRGIKKVMFGTNYPMLTPAACLEGLDELGLNDEAKAMFLCTNAAEVFKLELEA